MSDETRRPASEAGVLLAPAAPLPPPAPRSSVPPRPVTTPPRPSGSPAALRPSLLPPTRTPLAPQRPSPEARPSPPPPPEPSPPPPPTTAAPEVEARIASLDAALQSAQRELRRLGVERNALRSRLLAAGSRTAELESALRAEQELREQLRAEHRAAVAALRARLEAIEAAPARDRAAPSGLRKIRGIGPAYERALGALGVTKVEQIARWTEADVGAFAKRLKVKAERIRAEDWIGQARKFSE